jgi:membrane-anchored protein YejM (alkaline phosphatase superfamily)
MKILYTILFFTITFTAGFTQNRQTENVVLITLDGLRWQELYGGITDSLALDKEFTKDTAKLFAKYWRDNKEERRATLMPFIWNTIAKEGQLYGNRWYDNKVDCANSMWFSYPGYNEILSGKPDDENIHSNDKIQNPNTTVLEFLNQQPDYQNKIAAFGSWDVFPYIINEDRSQIPVNAGFETLVDSILTDKEMFLNTLQREIPSPWGSVRLDAFTHHFALEHLRKYHPKVLYIAYGETDDFAHDGRYDHYIHATNRSDKFIHEVWNTLQSDPFYKNKTTLIITTDHGRGTYPKDTWKHHGQKIKDAGEIWMAILGPDTEALGEVKVPGQLYQGQVASTVAAYLGFKFPEEGGKGPLTSNGNSK